MHGWLRRWPDWAGYAASTWAVLFGATLLLTGHGALYGMPSLGWLAAAVLAFGAGLAITSVRGGQWLPPRLVAAGSWSVVLVALAGSAFVLLDLISWAMNGVMLGRDGRPDWGPFAERLGFVGVAALFLARGFGVVSHGNRYVARGGGNWCVML